MQTPTPLLHSGIRTRESFYRFYVYDLKFYAERKYSKDDEKILDRMN